MGRGASLGNADGLCRPPCTFEKGAQSLHSCKWDYTRLLSNTQTDKNPKMSQWKAFSRDGCVLKLDPLRGEAMTEAHVLSIMC